MHARLLVWSLRQRRWRHVLNALVMAVTAAIVMLFVAVLLQLVAFIHKDSGALTRVLVVPRIGDADLPMSLYPTLQGIDGVQIVTHYEAFGGQHESGATYLIVGEEDAAMPYSTDSFPIEPAVLDAWIKERPMGAIMTDATANDLRIKVGDTADVPTSFGPLRLKVVGLSRGPLTGHRIAIHFDYAREFTKSTACGYRLFTKPGDFERVAREVIDRTKNSASPVTAINAARLAESKAREAAAVPKVLGFLGVFLLITTVLTLANSSAIAIRERRIEMATFRVLGYHRSAIARLMLSEVVLVGLAGGVLAVAVIMLLFPRGIQLTPGTISLLKPVQLGLASLVSGAITCVAVPLAGALPSVLSSVRQPLVLALRDSA